MTIDIARAPTVPLAERLNALGAAIAASYRACGVAEAEQIARVTFNDAVSGALPTHLAGDLDQAVRGIVDANLASALAPVAHELAWTHGDRVLPSGFHMQRCFVELAGPDGMTPQDSIRYGLYLQQPGSFYASHSHEAVEHYLPISGTALWQRGDGSFVARSPGKLITHASFEPHAMRTLDKPLLALWIWTGNLSFSTYRIDAE
jgi:mannose-6-phosphate isomerase-like protein (cupin superfamily)